MSEECVIKRDELIFEYALDTFNVPIVMVLSGGFQMKNAPNIAESIARIVKRFELK